MTSYFGIPTGTIAGVMAAAVAVLLLGLAGFALKNRVLLRMSVRNIPRRPAQSILILFGLMLASLIITASFGVGDTLAYSLKAIQIRQTGGIDEAVLRSKPSNVQGAGLLEADYFTPAQTGSVLTRVRSDPAVQAAQGVLVSDGSISDPRSGQATASNVLLLGAPGDFDQVWGRVTSAGGGTLHVGDLRPGEVFIGNAAATKLAARAGDRLRLFVAGKPTDFTIRDILDTEINPNVASQGPVVSSVIVPIATIRTMLGRPDGFNAIYVHNHGSGGLDDLGPAGATGQDVNRRLRGSFTDSAAAAEFKTYLGQAQVLSKIQAFYDNDNSLDPTRPSIQSLLVELKRPQVSDEFKSIVQDDDVRRVLAGAVAATVPVSATRQQRDDAMTTFGELAAALNVDTAAVQATRRVLTRPDVALVLRLAASAAPPGDPTAIALSNLSRALVQPGTSAHLKALLGSPATQAALTQVVTAGAPSRSAELTAAMRPLNLYQLVPYKQNAVTFAERAGTASLALLLGVSFFSLTVGVLLIFLIFVMLAAERRAEMGMSRAVGLKRRHLTQMFLFEGFGYTLGAAATGVVLGVAIGALMIRVISSIFSNFSAGIELQYHVEPTSLVISLCLGILLTFVVVGVSAYRVSRLNIVAAIRDIDDAGKRDEGLGHYVMAIGKTVASGLRMLLRGHPLTFLRRSTLGVAGAIRTLLWALFRRGPLTLALGLLLLSTGLSSHGQVVYDAGVGVTCIGIGLLVRWILTAAHTRPSISNRAGFTLAAAGLVLYFGQPFGRVEKLLRIDRSYGIDQLKGGAELFIIGSLLLLLGTIWMVMYNSDLLLRGASLSTRWLGGAGAGIRTAIAYPMATKFRTGMAVAMFATVTFILAYMAVFEDVLNQSLGQAATRAGGWEIVAGTPDNNFNPSGGNLPPSDVAPRVAGDPRLSSEVRATGWENASFLVPIAKVQKGVAVKQTNSRASSLHVVDDTYLANTSYALKPRAAGYSTDRAVWERVRANEGFAVIDSGVLQAQDKGPAAITGINPTDATFQPFEIEVAAPPGAGIIGARPWRVTIIGFTDQPLWDGLYVSRATALHRSGLFSAAAASSAAPRTAAGAGPAPLVPTGYYFRLQHGTRANQARLDLGRLLVTDQLEPVIVADQLAQQTSATVTLFNLLSGFLALGLVVGIAGLGVISTRAVVERRQQIGMMRAMGFRRSLVQGSFLLESSFIAILGLVIGTALGIWQSYRFIVIDKSFGAVDFHVPVIQLGLILGGAYLATLVTTWLPARQASRVAPAEALRYE